MLLNDKEIVALIEDCVIENADINGVGPAAYDLKTHAFHLSEGKSEGSTVLMPGDSVFVSSEEIVRFPGDIAGRVTLRNSRIRQGFIWMPPSIFLVMKPASTSVLQI